MKKGQRGASELRYTTQGREAKLIPAAKVGLGVLFNF